MPNSRRMFGVVISCLATFLLTHNTVQAQTFSTAQTTSTQPSQTKDIQFAESFWDYLLSNNYKHWSPAPGKSASHFSAQTISGTNIASPHGSLSKLYINRTAAGNPNAMPVGSVLILENYRADKSLDTISVMYRTAGFNPTANDWFWVNYNADGTISSSGSNLNGQQHMLTSARAPKKLAGRTASCIQCHQRGGKDLVFFSSQKQQLNRTATAQFPSLQPSQNR